MKRRIRKMGKKREWFFVNRVKTKREAQAIINKDKRQFRNYRIKAKKNPKKYPKGATKMLIPNYRIRKHKGGYSIDRRSRKRAGR